jgi:tetratricopeptide (TPR) repeat protein
MWWTRRRLEGLLAASLYDDLSEGERAVLERKLKDNPALRDEAEALRMFVGRLPVDPPELGCDLLPALNARLDQPRSRSHAPRRRLVLAGAMAMVLVGMISYGVWSGGAGLLGTPDDPDENTRISPVARLIKRAAAYEGVEDFPTARSLLKQAVEDHPQDPYAAQAQQKFAQLLFATKRYAEAYDAYFTLRRDYGPAFEERPDNTYHWNLLAEARQKDYAPLYELDAARRDPGGELARLEQVLARYYSLTTVAERAAKQMAMAVRDRADEADRPAGFVAALEVARAQCTNPVAIAQLNLELGHVYRDEMMDFTGAETCYRRAAEEPLLTKRAQDALMTVAQGTGSR